MAQLLQNSTIGGKQIASEEFVSNKVKADVPANAKFTDTVYSHPTSDGNKHVPATGTTNNGKVLKAGATAGSLVWGTDNDTKTTINGKTGAITKADIVALGIPAQDTVYTHPSAHPATIITQTSSYRFVTDAEKSTWNAKSNLALGETTATAYRGDRGKVAYDHSQVAHAPSNAQKNSNITKAEIEAKLTGAITSHTHSAYVPTSRTVAGKALTGNITLAKGDVGLGNVTNTSDANKPVSTAQQTALNAKIDANKFQVVAALPASPVTGVFYFVKE